RWDRLGGALRADRAVHPRGSSASYVRFTHSCLAASVNRGTAGGRSADRAGQLARRVRGHFLWIGHCADLPSKGHADAHRYVPPAQFGLVLVRAKRIFRCARGRLAGASTYSRTALISTVFGPRRLGGFRRAFGDSRTNACRHTASARSPAETYCPAVRSRVG